MVKYKGVYAHSSAKSSSRATLDDYAALSCDDSLEKLESSVLGLTKQEAQRRLQKFGLNHLKKKEGVTPLQLFLNQFKSFIIIILVIATVISAALGEWLDAGVIFVILVLNALMGFIQEFKAEKSIEALQKMSSLQALVLRNGKEECVDASKLVPGDVIILETGKKIPADARIIEANNLKTQEGALTGESLPVEKTADVLKAGLPLGNRANMLFSGTIITHGYGKAVIVSTGMKTELGKIARLLDSTEQQQTPLQKKLVGLGKLIGSVALVVCAILFFIGLLRGSDLVDIFLAAVSLLVATVPVGLALVITIVLGIGVQKMIKRKALMRNLSSLETLGALSVICSDKTGILTHNQMTVTHVYCNDDVLSVSGSGYDPKGTISGKIEPLLAITGALCNDAHLQKTKNTWGVIGDSTEACMLTFARKAGFDERELQKKFPRLDEISFDSDRKLMTTFHMVKGKKTSYTKGAPDNLLARCNRILMNGKVRKLSSADKKTILKQNNDFSKQALRVLGFAYTEGATKATAEKNMIFIGLQAMIDPPREDVKKAIATCTSAGIKVVMITGDNLVTAKAIAFTLGITGKDMEGKDITEDVLAKDVDSIGVFARVNPEYKLKIVDALQKKGHVVAMTGDGVTDAPALKEADVGVAMGITGTDVSKEAASMILTKDTFTSIVSAVEEGRTIYDNSKKFVNFLLSSNMSAMLVVFLAMIIGFTSDGSFVLPLLVIHILWVTFLTDGVLALALGLGPASQNIMRCKPRNSKEDLVSKNMLWNIIVIGVLVALGVLFVFNHALPFGIIKAQTMALTMFVVLGFVRLVMIRSQFSTRFFSNKFLNLSLLVVIVLQLLLIYSPVRNVFKLAPLTLANWAFIAIVATIICFIGVFASRIIRHATRKVATNDEKRVMFF